MGLISRIVTSWARRCRCEGMRLCGQMLFVLDSRIMLIFPNFSSIFNLLAMGGISGSF